MHTSAQLRGRFVRLTPTPAFVTDIAKRYALVSTHNSRCHNSPEACAAKLAAVCSSGKQQFFIAVQRGLLNNPAAKGDAFIATEHRTTKNDASIATSGPCISAGAYRSAAAALLAAED